MPFRGSKDADLTIVFHLEPADHSVGIMAEGFSAWEEGGTTWCDLESYDERDNFNYCTFAWYSNGTGEKTVAPPNAHFIEAALHAYARAYYQGLGDLIDYGPTS